MKTIFNEVTKKNEIQFNGKLVSLNTEKRFENSNQKGFFLGVIEFVNAAKKVVQSSCSVWEATVKKGIEVGQSYLATAQQADNGTIYIHCSNLQGASQASAEDFGFEISKVATASSVAQNADLVTA